MFRILDSPNNPSACLAQGPRLLLRHLGRSDLKRIKLWFRNLELVKLAFGVDGSTDLLHRIADEYYREIFWWQKNAVAVDLTDGECIGFCRYTIRDDYETFAKVGILIGEPDYWSHGYGTEAMFLLLGYLFERRQVKRVELDTADFNLRAQRSFEKCGFHTIGTSTEVNFLDGRTSQKIWMSIGSERYRQLVLDCCPSAAGDANT